jgi:hypothetical protein
MKTLSVTLALAALVLACQKGDDRKKEESGAPPPPPTADRPATIAREDMPTLDAMAQFIGGLHRAVEDNRADCDQMAAALAPVMERGRPALEKARVLEKKIERDQEARRWVEAYVEEKSGGFDAAATGIGACADHPGVQQALAGFIQ